jgi:DNA invertase Pin-like site-specific DNA recombinase
MARKVRQGRPSSDGPLHVCGYCRVSLAEQADSGAGLAAQRDAISVACASRGYQLVEIVEDAGWSGKDLDRPGITAVIARIEAGEAGALLVAKLDRLSRSLLDFAQLMERARRKGWSIIALDLGVDTSTPAGEMMANVLATFSQFERRLIGQRTREAMAQKKAAGQHMGRRRSMPQELVDRIVAERRAGATLQAIADGLTADAVAPVAGGTAWYPSTVRYALVAAGES